MNIIRPYPFIAIFTFLLFLGLCPLKASAQIGDWPGEGASTLSWALFDTDNDGEDENGCADHRDVVQVFTAVDADYLYLGAIINGTNAFHVEYLLMVEDRLDNTDLPGAVDETRDALGEVYLLESSFDPDAPPPQGDFSEVWTVPEPDDYIQVGGLPASNTYDWIREYDDDTGTPGLGGLQDVRGGDIGYRITGNYVDMYVSWSALGDPDGVCLLWATDTSVPNLDQTPHCDRVSHEIDSCVDAIPRTATLTIIKTAPDGGSFDFTAGGGLSPTNFSLGNGGSQVFSDLEPGVSYGVTEADEAGYQLTSIVCSDDKVTVDVDNRNISVELAPGDDITCTFTNIIEATEGEGTITIIKDATPKDGQDFGFTGDLGSFTLDNDADPTYPASRSFVVTAENSPFDVTETVPSGWDLADIDCSSTGTLVVSSITDGVRISLVDGDDVTCTFYNAKQGVITIEKDAEPPDAQSFDFSQDIDGTGNFSLSDGQSKVFSSISTFESGDAVTYGREFTVTELDPDPYFLKSIVCTDPNGNSAVDLASRTATIRLDPGEDITCTFENLNDTTLGGILTIRKEALPLTDEIFVFQTDIEECVCQGQFPLLGDGISNEAYFEELAPGQYTFAEIVPEGWELFEIECVENGQTIATITDSDFVIVDLQEGVDVTCTFKNKSKPKLPIPSLTPWGVLALLILMGGVSCGFLKKRKKRR
ncbi:MAG: hypothetical protein JRK53_25535 [Deltaproteobacteria bacterium]|nr:hypothetical protein [Deltaproteobacteria bacterium]